MAPMSVKKGTVIGTPEEWYAKGEQLEDEGDAAGAVAAYRSALQLDPTHRMARFDAVQALIFDLQDPAGAIELIQATPMSAMDSDLMYLRGRALAEQGKQEEAIGFYQRALQMFKDGTSVANSRSAIHCAWSLDLRDLGRTADALPIAEKAVALEPVYAHAWECLGYFQYLAGDLDTALQSLALAVALDPSSMADSLREDPDFGEFREDPRFEAMLKTKELTDGARELVPTLWPKTMGAHEALPVFLAAVRRFVRS
jgi:tetratricopeptide (TPR) repeat protein